MVEDLRRLRRRIRDALVTFNLATALVFGLFAIVVVVLLLAAFTCWVLTTWGGMSVGELLSVEAVLVVVFVLSIVMGVCVNVMVRRLILAPVRQMVGAMDALAAGDFDARMPVPHGPFVPAELRDFAESYNAAAEELGSTELLRKDFVNNFSHEFKTPIVAMHGFAELLLEEDLPDEDRREYLGIIRDESSRLASLATSVLTLSKIESQTILAERVPFSLDEQLRQCVLVVDQRWAARGLALDVDLERVELAGDEALLREVWMNLLDNAAKFSDDGGAVEVRLWAEGAGETGELAASGGAGSTWVAAEDAGGAAGLAAAGGAGAEGSAGGGAAGGAGETPVPCAHVRVRDHGLGMDEATQARMWEQFYQGDTSRATQGNGLGLAMVQKVVELHGGRVDVTSAPGEGSTFEVVLPLA